MIDIVEICGVGKDAIIKAMKSDFKDLEDAIQHFSARAENIDAIIIRNKKDFKFFLK